jgi:hypothetical protein
MDNPIAADAFGVPHGTPILGNLQMQGASRTLPENVEVLSASLQFSPVHEGQASVPQKLAELVLIQHDPTSDLSVAIGCQRLPSCFVSLPKSLQ